MHLLQQLRLEASIRAELADLKKLDLVFYLAMKPLQQEESPASKLATHALCY
jgi:hypothetical protein